jgi:hypothetical protein
MEDTMRSDKRRYPQPAWWLLGASGLLQPLSEAFLYRSPEDPQPDSYRRRAKKTGGRHV